MHATFCDKCGTELAERWRAPIAVRIKNDEFELCRACGAGIVEMLKDMRLIKELDTIR